MFNAIIAVVLTLIIVALATVFHLATRLEAIDFKGVNVGDAIESVPELRAEIRKLRHDFDRHIGHYDTAIDTYDGQFRDVGVRIDTLEQNNQRTFEIHTKVISEHENLLAALTTPVEPPPPHPVDIESNITSSVLDAALNPEHSPRPEA